MSRPRKPRSRNRSPAASCEYQRGPPARSLAANARGQRNSSITQLVGAPNRAALAVRKQEKLDDYPCTNEYLAVIVQDFEPSDLLDLLGNLVLDLFLPGDPQVANLAGAPALDQCLLDIQETTTKDDDQDCRSGMPSRPQGLSRRTQPLSC